MRESSVSIPATVSFAVLRGSSAALEQTKGLERATSRYVTDQAWFLIKARFFLVI